MKEDIEQQFVAGFRRAGLAIPHERYDLMLAAYEGYRDLAQLLHQPLDYALEPIALHIPAQPVSKHP